MNKFVINLLGILTTIFLVAACNPVATSSTVKVYKAQGSMSCDSASGVDLSVMLNEFKRSGINVRSANCGSDGLVRAAVCGIATGKVNVYEIDSADLNTAKGMGFKNIESLKGYTPISC